MSKLIVSKQVTSIGKAIYYTTYIDATRKVKTKIKSIRELQKFIKCIKVDCIIFKPLDKEQLS